VRPGCVVRSLQTRQSRYMTVNSVTKDMAHAARSWSREYLPRCSPFITCALVGPASMHIQGYQGQWPSGQGDLASETLLLVIRCVAQYWTIGQVLIGMCGKYPMVYQQPPELTPQICLRRMESLGVQSPPGRYNLRKNSFPSGAP
jgi:hypothetical protein